MALLNLINNFYHFFYKNLNILLLFYHENDSFLHLNCPNHHNKNLLRLFLPEDFIRVVLQAAFSTIISVITNSRRMSLSVIVWNVFPKISNPICCKKIQDFANCCKSTVIGVILHWNNQPMKYNYIKDCAQP